MSRVAYVNGAYEPHGRAVVHIEDRGYQFGDGVYEVWAVFNGKLADAEGHFTRLQRSLGELQIVPPMGEAALKIVLHEVLRRNRIRDGLLYLQITRGVARRDHVFPTSDTPPALVISARATDPLAAALKAAKGIAVITLPENRWGRCDIKTINLLPNILAKQAAKVVGAGEAWFVDADGMVTEGASSNPWIVDRNGRLRTRTTTANILRGVTRSTLMGVIADSGLEVSEQPFTVEDAKAAREAFITGAGALVMPVTSIDGHILGNGHPGALASRLRAAYLRVAALD